MPAPARADADSHGVNALKLIVAAALVGVNAFFVIAEYALVRELKFSDFSAAIAFVNQVAERAEALNHHPDILVHGWNKVRLTLSTHSAGGITDADFGLARELDALA